MSKKQQTTRRAQRQAQREERRREEERRRATKKRLTIWIGVSVAMVVVIITSIILNSFVFPNFIGKALAMGTKPNPTTTITSDNPAYPPINGVGCQSMEQLAYHVHAHLSIYINGQPSALPANIGIASDLSCYYWLHTHSTDGIIHVESPTPKTYSLGTFFREWQDSFSQLGYPSQLNTTTGWQAYVDGKPYNGDFHNIEVVAHRLITLAYNSPDIKPDTDYNWADL